MLNTTSQYLVPNMLEMKTLSTHMCFSSHLPVFIYSVDLLGFIDTHQ